MDCAPGLNGSGFESKFQAKSHRRGVPRRIACVALIAMRDMVEILPSRVGTVVAKGAPQDDVRVWSERLDRRVFGPSF